MPDQLSPHEVEYVGGPLDGYREILSSAIDRMACCRGACYIRDKQNWQRMVFVGWVTNNLLHLETPDAR